MAAVTYAIYIDWDNNGSVLAGAPTANETVTTNVLGLRTPLSWALGRDTARSLSEIQLGSITLELDNRTRIYSPDNTGSALYNNLGPGKPIRIIATHNAIAYNLFWGFIDDYSIDPHREKKSVMITATDALGRLSETAVSTTLYPSVQTGAAIGYVLDAAGWPASQRSLDTGASTVRWFWAESLSALDVIKALVKTEGGPAVAFVDQSGNFVFRDRHHRFLRSASITSQATISDTGTEPLFSAPAEYNIGYRDLINQVTFSIDERAGGDITRVWATEDTFTVAVGETITIPVLADNPFYNADIPLDGTDYVLQSGSIIVDLTKTSGISTSIVIYASAAAVITGMALRANPVTVARTFLVTDQNQASIDKYGKTSNSDGAPEYMSKHDAEAAAAVILAQRSERLPVISVTVNNGNDTRKVQQLSRAMSDRITIVEAHTGTNHAHFIERVEHNIAQIGKEHTVQLGCERVRTVTGTQFTFDTAGAGFDQGSFGLAGFDDSATIFILDSNVAGHRLDSGRLAT